MMTEISLHVLDIAWNSIRANATLIHIEVTIQTDKDILIINISDNGCGMTKEELLLAEDPFYTTRTTRKIGLGIPLFKDSIILTGGNFTIESTPMVGTSITGIYTLSHINRMPLGDMVSTIHSLVTCNYNIDIIYTYKVDNSEFTLDTTEFRQILGDIPFHVNDVSNYIKEYLIVNTNEVNNGRVY